jgi:putative phosphoesterase
VKVVVLADTHLRTEPGGTYSKWLPASAEPLLEGADVILHAGDVLDQGVLERLRRYGPVHAVLGNNDTQLTGALPETTTVDLAGVGIGMIHDSGPSPGRARRMRRRFPGCDVVVFGHSHAPVNELGQDGQVLFNPGSPTQRRVQPARTLGQLVLEDGVVVERRIIPLD